MPYVETVMLIVQFAQDEIISNSRPPCFAQDEISSS